MSREVDKMASSLLRALWRMTDNLTEDRVLRCSGSATMKTRTCSSSYARNSC